MNFLKRGYVLLAMLVFMMAAIQVCVFADDSDFVINDGVLNQYRGNATEVVVPKGVIAIDNEAFSGATSVVKITLPDTLEIIGDLAFERCSSLKTITFPTNFKHIGTLAFCGCKSLTSINLPANVDYVGAMAFYGCESLQKITVASANKYYASQDGVLFNKAKTILVRCPEAKTGSYTMPTTVLGIDDAAFYGCSKLTSIRIASGVSFICEDTFSGCTALKSINIPGNVTTISEGAFEDCVSLTMIMLGKSVSTIGPGAFRGCTGLKELMVAPGNESLSVKDGVLFNKNKTELLVYPGGKEGKYTVPKSVTTIRQFAFSECTGLTAIAIPLTVTNISGGAFFDCKGLKNIYYPGSLSKWNTLAASAFLADSSAKINVDYKLFDDVPITAWYEKSVKFVYDKGIMSGTSELLFAPDSNLTRGQVVVMLWNLEGRPSVKGVAAFPDVPADKYYAKAVDWARKTGVVSGYSDGKFKPTDYIKRQDFVCIMRNYAKYKGQNTSITSKDAYKACSDYAKVSKYAVDAVMWGYNRGLIGASGKLDAMNNIKRSEAATMMERFLK